MSEAKSTSDDHSDLIWEHRWTLEQMLANRVAFYMLAQSFLVIASVSATLSTTPLHRWLPISVAIDAAGLFVTLVFWYVFTENVRMLETLKAEVDRRYKVIGLLRTSHQEKRRARQGPVRLLSRLSPSKWLTSGVSVIFGGLWITLIVIAIAST